VSNLPSIDFVMDGFGHRRFVVVVTLERDPLGAWWQVVDTRVGKASKFGFVNVDKGGMPEAMKRGKAAARRLLR
jgi:hypothetical protein